MRTLPVLGLVPVALLLAACADDAVDDDAGGSTPTSSTSTGVTSTTTSGGLEISFEPQACDAATCWVVPVPRGNLLTAMRALPGGVAYGVGEHGAFVRWDGARWTAAALPDALHGPLGSHSHLRGVAPIADDDVWLVGDEGTVLHYDGHAVRASGPDAARSTHYVDVIAQAPDDVWVADRAGRIHHFDGSGWTTAFAAGAPILDVWMPDATELWALGVREGGIPFTVHYDGASFVTADVPHGTDLLLASGGAVALSGFERGRPWIAFEQGLLRRRADGSWETLYDPAYQPPYATPSDLLVTGPDEAYLATPDTLGGTVTRYAAGETTHPTVAADLVYALGNDGGAPWFLGPGGSIASPTRPATDVSPTVSSVPGTINDPLHATLCAPSSGAIFCAVERGDDVYVTRTTEIAPVTTTVAGPFPPFPPIVSIHANAVGDVVLAREEEMITVPVGQPATITPVGAGQLVDVRQAVVRDDGGTVAVKTTCDLYRASALGTAASHVTYADPRFADDLRFCRLHAHPGNVVYVTGWYSTTGTDDGLRLVVIRADDGTTIFDAPLPDYFVLDSPVVVSAAGVPWIALDTGGGWKVFVGNGNVLSPTSFAPLDAPLLAARGEAIFAIDPAERPASVLRRLDDPSSAPVVLPLHGAAALATTSDRAWVQAEGAILAVKGE